MHPFSTFPARSNLVFGRSSSPRVRALGFRHSTECRPLKPLATAIPIQINSTQKHKERHDPSKND